MSTSVKVNIVASKQDSRELVLPHQQAAVEAMNSYFSMDSGNAGAQSGLLVMPTGSGKTFTAVNWLIHNAIPKGYRIIWLAHRQELIDQTYNEFIKQTPRLSAYGLKSIKIIAVSGIHSSMSQASRHDVNICSIQSVAHPNGLRFVKSMLGEAGARKVVIIIDEAHHSISASYQKVLKRITDINPDRVLLGLTATPTRMSDKEKKKLFNMFNVLANIRTQSGSKSGYIYEVKLKQLIRDGFLAKPIYIKIETNIEGEVEYKYTLDDEFYFQKYQDFSESMKTEIAKSSSRNKVIVDEYVQNQEKYGKTLVFAVNQLHAETLTQEFRTVGISCDCVRSDKPDAYSTIRDFKKGKFDVLVNVQILTEGSDVPDIQTIFLTRETNSDSLLMQMIGRGLRGKASGGTETAYIVDFHDKWDKFVLGLDPKDLDVFDYENIDDTDDNENGNIQDGPVEDEKWELVGKAYYNFGEAYLRLYSCMKSNVLVKKGISAIPCGWYSVADQNGVDDIVLVYEQQLPNYEELSKLAKDFVAKHYPADHVLDIIFGEEILRPTEQEMQEILDAIKDTGNMPDFYTFDERIDPKDIVHSMRKAGLLEDDPKTKDKATSWLKDLYDKKSILRNIYKNFFLFKKTIELAAKEKVDAVVENIDDRERYNVVDNYYDLNKLLNEVLREYPFLNTNGLMGIFWSSRVVRTWFGICKKWTEDGQDKYHIMINKLLSSPQVDPEVIKYLIYHEMLHKSGLWQHDLKFREKEWAYKNSEELDAFLDQLAINYKLDFESLSQKHKKSTSNNSAKDDITPDGLIALPQEVRKNDIVKTPDPEESQASQASVPNTPVVEDQSLGSDVGIKTGRKYCRECGNSLPTSAKFCDRCGNPTNY